ncbi:MAG TPA: cell division protein FtsW, partial [Ramlibacter sp.]|nr:cell division protein FtsW [Ramlibacter sp.]
MNLLPARVIRWIAGSPTGEGVLPVRISGYGGGTAAAPRAQVFDQTLVWVAVGLLAFGLVMVYSASIAMPDNPRFARYTPTFFLTRHILGLVMAFVAALLA